MSHLVERLHHPVCLPWAPLWSAPPHPQPSPWPALQLRSLAHDHVTSNLPFLENCWGVARLLGWAGFSCQRLRGWRWPSRHNGRGPVSGSRPGWASHGGEEGSMMSPGMRNREERERPLQREKGATWPEMGTWIKGLLWVAIQLSHPNPSWAQGAISTSPGGGRCLSHLPAFSPKADLQIDKADLGIPTCFLHPPGWGLSVSEDISSCFSLPWASSFMPFSLRGTTCRSVCILIGERKGSEFTSFTRKGSEFTSFTRRKEKFKQKEMN